ncbi:hypothetical protein KVR01_003107 [Diaporthe batatas]|uniref:uncharacterized protein n=1 Tax=Diaporthe batatas TaxID=748121 RepID=UPI001D049B3A|nr:uncharacterized protein KVR01_003107 [Diaporthe batatas]KAG8167418.1 hypothetical protein KVR01_003107 [Diaporthe batatas]
MLSFLARRVPRTPISHLESMTLDGGRSTAEFRPPTDRYLVLNRLPRAASDREAAQLGLPHAGATSSLAPPLHRHLWQDEIFHVIKGTARFTLGTSRSPSTTERLASAGEVVVIPRRAAHTFCNASEDEELVLEFVLDPASRDADEAYFPGVKPSVFQALLFMHRGGVARALPGPDGISIVLGMLLNYVGGAFIGKWLLGYSASYHEYYRPRSPSKVDG